MLKSQMLKIDEENVSLRSKNRFLLEAQKTFEVKFKKINNLLTIYKHYNKNCPKNITGIGCTTNNHSHNRNKSENNYNFLAVLPSKNKFSVESFAFSNNNDLLSTDEVNNRDLDFLETRIREQLMTDKESKRIVNLSLIDSEECKNEDYSERAQYIKFIQNMGNYLNEIYKGGDMSGLRKKKIRSNSLIGTCNTVRQLSNLNTILAKKPGQISEQNKYLSLRFDFKETFNKISQKSNFNIPNPRLERNLISPISKPNDKERGASYVSTLRKNYNHGGSIGNLGNEEIFC